jgi:NADPH2:quinone reductase
LLSGEGRAHHGEILRETAGKLRPRTDPRRFTFATIRRAYHAIISGTAAGEIIVDTEPVTSPE